MPEIYDVIHNFITFDSTEERIIKTLPMQRLKAIMQIPTAQPLFGSGTHDRFSHSLGVMHVASLIYDSVTGKENFKKLFPNFSDETKEYWRRVLRLSALMHDIGHLPFSHAPELKVLGKKGHEKWTMKIIESSFIAPILKEEGVSAYDVVKIAVGPETSSETFSPWELALTHMITGDHHGADRIDYVMRDTHYTGLKYGLIDHLQLINHLRLIPFEGEIRLGLDEDGLEACYALLLARFFMHKRLYQHPKALGYAYHMQEVVVAYFQKKPVLESVDRYIRVNDHHIYAAIYDAVFDPENPCHYHAKAILSQDSRIEVVPMNELEFKAIKEQMFEKVEDISFETLSVKKGNFCLNFPVLLKNGIVSLADDVAEVQIPEINQEFAFVQPSSVNLVKKYLLDVKKSQKEHC